MNPNLIGGDLNTTTLPPATCRTITGDGVCTSSRPSEPVRCHSTDTLVHFGTVVVFKKLDGFSLMHSIRTKHTTDSSVLADGRAESKCGDPWIRQHSLEFPSLPSGGPARRVSKS